MFVRIVRLLPFRALSFAVLHSTSPEVEALERLRHWAAARGRPYTDPAQHLVFGRNVPTPKPGAVWRGYEFLLTVDDDAGPEAGEGTARIAFPGGLYAVVASRGIEALVSNYQRLAAWIEASADYQIDFPPDYDFEHRPGLELEHHLDPDNQELETLRIDAYVPIAPKRRTLGETAP